MKSIIIFILGISLGIAGYRYYTRPSTQTVSVGEEPRTGPAEVKQAMKDTFNTPAVKEELNKTGQAIRENAQHAGQAIADATANARTTATIKGKLLKDTGLSAFKIDVDTTDGVVTLSGAVNSSEEIERATKLAADTEGVKKVVSVLQVKGK